MSEAPKPLKDAASFLKATGDLIKIVFLIVVFFMVWQAFSSTGTVDSEVIKKIIFGAVVLILVVLALQNVEEPVIAVGLIAVAIAVIAYLTWGDAIAQGLSSIIPSVTPPDEKVAEEVQNIIARAYAGPGEVFILGMRRVNTVADAVGQRGWQQFDYIVIVRPQILKLTMGATGLSATDTWNYWVSGRHLMVLTLSDGRNVTVELSCELLKFNATVWPWDAYVEQCGNGYDLEQDHYHVPEADAQCIKTYLPNAMFG